MSEFTRTDFYFILIFWVVLPSVDQYTDIFMIMKLLGGPNDEQNVKSGTLSVLVSVPVPQVAEHVFQDPHTAHAPSTANIQQCMMEI